MAKLKKINTEQQLVKEYSLWLKEIKDKIRSAQIKAATYVNTELLTLYWDLGKTITDKQSKSKWGDGIIEQLSKDLIREFPEMKGFSLTNLKYIRQWYQFYSPVLSQQLVGGLGKNQKSQQLVGLIPWGHHIQILTKCKDVQQALFYIRESYQNNWSRSVLVHQMESNLYKRQGKAITNFKRTLPKSQSDLANEMLKNPYNLDFLSLGKQVRERDLERAIINNLQKFLLELGKGFAYVGNQYNIVVEDDDFFLDLLFYNYHLHCFVVFELKIGAFKPEYAGKLNFYLNTVDEQIKTKEHKPTIGILLCKTPNKTVVEYSLRGLVKPIGVTNYQLSKVLPKKLKIDLPTVEELEAEIDREYEELKSPSEKRFDTLKQKISKLKSEEIKQTRTTAILFEIVDKSLLPLYKALIKRLDDFKELFYSSTYYWQGENGNITNLTELAEQWKNEKFLNSRHDFYFYYNLNGFKKAGIEPFDERHQLNFRIDEYNYGFSLLNYSHHPIVKKLYHQQLTRKEIELIVDTVYNSIMDSIERRIEQLNTGK